MPDLRQRASGSGGGKNKQQHGETSSSTTKQPNETQPITDSSSDNDDRSSRRKLAPRSNLTFWQWFTRQFTFRRLAVACTLLFFTNIALAGWLVATLAPQWSPLYSNEFQFAADFASSQQQARIPSSDQFAVQQNTTIAHDYADNVGLSANETKYGVRIPCNQTAFSKDTWSALDRAKTSPCRQQLVDTACRMQWRNLTAKWLPRTCPTADHENRHKFIGCFLRYKKYRKNETLMKGPMDAPNPLYNTPYSCSSRCQQIGYQIAGVYEGISCQCAIGETVNFTLDSLLEYKVPNFLCHMNPCPGNKNVGCGTRDFVSLYNTGLGYRDIKYPQYVDPKTYSPYKSAYGKWNTSMPYSPFSKVVFLFQFNGRNIRQIRRLLKVVYRPWHYYFVHVDVRQHYLYNSMLDIKRLLNANGYKNFHVTDHRYSTIWGGADLLDMYLHAARDILTDLSEQWPDWDYIVNMSENCMMIGTMPELETLLHKYRGYSFVASSRQQTRDFMYKQGYNNVFSQCEDHMWLLGMRDQTPTGVVADGGSDWMVLHRSAVEYIAFSRDPLVLGLTAQMRNHLLPLESYMHVVLRNSHLCTLYMDTNLKHTNWDRLRGCNCQHRHIVDWCGCSPLCYKTHDWDLKQTPKSRLVSPFRQQTTSFFARKFESMIDMNSYALAEEQARGSPSPFRNDSSFDRFWQNYFHYKYDEMNRQRHVDDGAHGFNPVSHSMKHRWIAGIARQVFTMLNNMVLNKRADCFIDNDYAPIQLTVVKHSSDPKSYPGALAHFRINCTAMVPIEKNKQKSLRFVYEIETVVERNWPPRPQGQFWKFKDGRTGTLLGSEVSSDYDKGEQLFRNFPSIMAGLWIVVEMEQKLSDDVPTIRYVWSMPPPNNMDPHKWLNRTKNEWQSELITVVWIRPDNTVHSARPKYIEISKWKKFVSNFSELLHENETLEPGLWRAEIWVRNEKMVHSVPFAIFPHDEYPDDDGKLFDSIMKDYYIEREFCLAAIRAPNKRYREQIKAFADRTIHAMSCKNMEWSSFFPDPKSEIKEGRYSKHLQVLL